jgi:RND family efflux transporter MFP subunit
MDHSFKRASIPVSIGLFALLLVVAYLYRVPIASWILASSQEKTVQGDRGRTSGTKPAERKVLYWYDQMNPERHYDKPGKAPDGMDLAPKYADETNGSGSSGDMGSMPGMKLPENQGTAKSTPQGERRILYYYDAMNPGMRSDKPGKAPDGMDLVPMYADTNETTQNMPPGTVMVSSTKQQLIGVRTDVVKQEPLNRTIRTVAQVQIDETKIARVHVKIAGWVDQIHVDFVGKLVHKGQPLFSFYSPDLVATQQEYLIARRGQQELGAAPFSEVSKGSETLLQAARERLRLWDISDEQVRKLDETGEVSRTITMYSPVDGFVVKREVYDKMYLTPETELYELVDLSTVWVNAEIYEYEVPYVKLGQPATMTLSYFPGRTYKGKVVYIYPMVDPTTRTVKVRLEFPNANFDLKPDMFAEAQLNIGYGTEVFVPQEAVLDSGTEQIVFVALGNGYFEPRKVQLGPRLDDRVVVLSGLKAGEQIVTSGNFLIDSESRLKSAMGGMTH